MRVSDFDYDLPPDLIAQFPLEQRSNSRLLIADPVDKTIVHSAFRKVGEFLQSGDLLVFNNSKVLPARLYGIKAETGAKIEFLLVKPVSSLEWLVLARPAKRLQVGSVVQFLDKDSVLATATVLEVLDDGIRRVRFEVAGSPEPGMFERFLDRIGSMPLPPYIQQPLLDKTRYQTVYAKTPGSVAAPTAGLHFTDQLMGELRAAGMDLRYVTLHVGLGTFRPVQADAVEDHVMHSETYEVSESVADAVNRARAEGRRVVAVGTTALRTLESAGASGRLIAGQGDTNIFIYPGYQFKLVDALITNFHLPKSTLLMLVATMMGFDFTKQVYEEAVRERYRFFSFGDAMMVTRRTT